MEIDLQTFLRKHFDRKFDGLLQKERGPIGDRERFNMLIGACMMHMRNGKLDDALKAADELVDMEPLRGIPWTCRAQALALDGQFSQAIAACQRAVDIDPSDPEKWELLATMYDLKGSGSEAVAVRKRVQELRSP